LGAGPSGVFSGDITVSEAGALLVAGAPVGNPSTVVIWEVTPWGLNSSGGTQQVAVKPTVGMQLPLLATPPSWLGIAPLAAYLLSWQEQASGEIRVEGEDYMGPLLQCSVVSNFSAYINPEASASSGWGSGVSVVAFDPSSGGNALITVIVEGRVLHIPRGSRCWSFSDWLENTKVGECTKTGSDTCTIGQCRESSGHDDNMDCSGEQHHKQGGSIKRPAYESATEEEKGAPHES